MEKKARNGRAEGRLMDIESEIIVIKLTLAWSLRSDKCQASTDQEVDDIIADFLKQGGTFLPDGQSDRVRESLTGLLSDGRYAGLTRPSAGEHAEARKIRAGLG